MKIYFRIIISLLLSLATSFAGVFIFLSSIGYSGMSHGKYILLCIISPSLFVEQYIKNTFGTEYFLNLRISWIFQFLYIWLIVEFVHFIFNLIYKKTYLKTLSKNGIKI